MKKLSGKKSDTGKLQPVVGGMRIEVDQEDDGRWIAEIPELAGVMVYGSPD